MSKLTQFSPPAYLTDLKPENAKLWSSEFLSPRMTRESKLPQVTQFYNEVTSNYTETPTRADITWTAFPNNVLIAEGSDTRRWRVADSNRGFQDEYCEWSVQRENGKIVRVVFTAEGPEYWKHLAKWQPDTVLELYRKHNPGFDIKKEDLFPDGEYKKDNKWNDSTTTGSIMHLIQKNNTLGAQFHLGGQSTVLRVDGNNRPIRDADSLIRCSRLGGPDRNSDPHIGISINNLAQKGPLITIADPIGLYLHSFDGSSFKAPDDTDVNEFWNWTRGTPADTVKGRGAHWVRAVFEVPKEKGYTVSDIEDQNGNKIQWGSQLADNIQVRLTGQVIRTGLHASAAHRCIGAGQAVAAAGFAAANIASAGIAAMEAKVASIDSVEVEKDEFEEENVCDRSEGIAEPGWACY